MTLIRKWLNLQDSSDQAQGQNTGIPVRRLQHSMINFEPRNRTSNFRSNLLLNDDQNNQNSFVLPSLTELELYDRRRNPRSTESRITEVV